MKLDINNLDNLPVVLTVMEVANVLRLKRSTAYELVRQKAIPCFRVGRHIRIARTELEKLIKDSNSQ